MNPTLRHSLPAACERRDFRGAVDLRKVAEALLAGALGLLLAATVNAAAERRLLNPADINAVRDIDAPQLSPDGKWVAYTVRSADHVKDKRITHVWMASWDGSQSLQLTNSDSSEHTPKWSPDGRYLSFLTSRGDDDAPEQLWVLDRLGGEAQPLTGFNGDVLDYEWSPDGKRLALIVSDEDPRKRIGADKEKTPPPIVIDRFYFKEDESGYLTSVRDHLYLFDVASRKAELLTPGAFDEYFPAWSPDGTQIAFVSNRSGDADRNNEFGIYVIAAHAGAKLRLVTTFQGEAGDSSWMSGPVWRPDGREIAYVTAGDPKLIYYSTHHLALIPASGGTPRILTTQLDRNVLQPQWTADGRSIYGLIEDDRNQHLARIDASNGRIERILDGRREISTFDVGPGNRMVVLDSNVDSPAAAYAVEGRKTRVLTRHNDEWLASVRLAATDEISFPSKDGTQISGFVVKPPGYVAGRRYPTLLWIHGGPVSQFANSFELPWQILASHGYVVVSANPRGSSGRGEKFSTAIYADWGNKDSEDVLSAVDYVVQRGIADPERLGVGGWSYGGILTNQVIARDTRFRSATSGASLSNALAGYGTDMYVREYEAELGVPWKNLDIWLRNSYPFLHADRIKTPTLFLCGDQDFNVPLLNSEQMYQALRSLGVDTQLVIYPGQYHGLRKPSYLEDRITRYLGWHGKYLGVPAAGGNAHSAL